MIWHTDRNRVKWVYFRRRGWNGSSRFTSSNNSPVNDMLKYNGKCSRKMRENCALNVKLINVMLWLMLQRKFQTYFRMPGEAQKIERLMEVFGQRYCQCNPQTLQRLQNPDTVFVLSFAVIMLNTDLHTPSIKSNFIIDSSVINY